MCVTAIAFDLFCLALSREFGASNQRTMDALVKAHGLPLFLLAGGSGASAAPHLAAFPAHVVDEDAAHGRRGHNKEMIAARKRLRLTPKRR
jgi:hypothetical protein